MNECPRSRLALPSASVRCVVAMILLFGCAPALPPIVGASTTPSGRTDLSLGGAARIPVGDFRELGPAESRYREVVDNGGVVPLGFVRHGITRHLDVGLMIAGTTARLELRGEVGVEEGSTRPAWVWGIAPFIGVIAEAHGADGDSGSGMRYGLDVPVAYGTDFGGIYDVWLGARVGVEGVTGEFVVADVEEGAWAMGLRAMAMLGLAAGFRRLHAYLEVSVGYEHWWGAHGNVALDRGGFVVVPAFGVRVRI